jgi:hypothetical protein
MLRKKLWRGRAVDDAGAAVAAGAGAGDDAEASRTKGCFPMGDRTFPLKEAGRLRVDNAEGGDFRRTECEEE